MHFTTQIQAEQNPALKSGLKVYVFDVISKSCSSTLHQVTNRLYWGHTQYPTRQIQHCIKHLPWFTLAVSVNVEEPSSIARVFTTIPRGRVRQSGPISRSDGQPSSRVVMKRLFPAYRRYTAGCKYVTHNVLLCNGEELNKTRVLSKLF